MIDRTPYTYLIGWTKLDKWYYGVKYAKIAHLRIYLLHILHLLNM